jgi:hypothetical protein
MLVTPTPRISPRGARIRAAGREPGDQAGEHIGLVDHREHSRLAEHLEP